MKLRLAVITDIHGNIEGLNAILNDIKKNNVDQILCLGDTIGIGPNSKECIDILIDNKIKMVLGNHELYLLKGTDIEPTIIGEEKEHYTWVKKSMTEREINYIKKCPLYYEYKISYDNKFQDKKIIFSHYLIKDINAKQPFESNHLKKDVNLWIKYNDPNVIHIIGHLHNNFNINEVEGISEDYIEQTGELTNIEIVDSAGCTHDDIVSYMMIEIEKGIKLIRKRVKFDRDTFINKILNTNFPDKKNILKYFYGIE